MAAAGDNASRKTASTGVCETSQTEYISKSKDDDDDEEESGDGKSQEKRSEDKEEAKMEEMAKLNVKMLFLHNEQVRIAEVSIKDVICLDTKLPLLTSRCL